MSNKNTEKECKCGKILQTVLLALILVGTSVSAFYSYKTSKVLDGIVEPQGAQAKTITETYAKGQTLAAAKESGKPVIAIFYADWCGYCKKFAPTFAKIIKKREFKSNLAAAFVNGDDPNNAEYMQEYAIEGFPTVMMINFKTGEKTKVPNNLLFMQTAEKDLLTKFVEFSKK